MNYPNPGEYIPDQTFVRRDGETVTVTPKHLSDDVLERVRTESARAHLKHAAWGSSIFEPEMPRGDKLTALVEELGEVARALTRDDGQGKEHLIKELIQAGNVALTWAQSEIEGDVPL